MSADGFVSLDDLLKLPQFTSVRRKDIYEVVRTNDKQRFDIRDGRIRANQGHSIKTLDDEAMLTPITRPLRPCVHGTYRSSLDAIKQSGGLKPMSRKHVHFANGLFGEVQSGMRGNCDAHIYLDMDKAMKAGMKFFLSKNGVILTSGLNGIVSTDFFERVDLT